MSPPATFHRALLIRQNYEHLKSWKINKLSFEFLSLKSDGSKGSSLMQKLESDIYLFMLVWPEGQFRNLRAWSVIQTL